MKKITKILSSVLAASMVISAFAMNAFADSKARTVTITPSKTEGIEAGETIVVEISMDNTEALVSCGYTLNYDTAAFEVDTTKVSRVEKCIDKTWLDGIKDTDGDWGYYLGNPTYNVATAGAMKFSWAGSEGVEAEYAMDNRVIGKFNINVKADAPDGEYVFSLSDAVTGDAGENSTADMVCAPVTVTVGTPAPDKTDVVVAPVASYDKSDAFEKDGAEYYHAAFKKEITVTADNNAVAGLTLEADKAVDVMFDTVVKDGTVNVAINILNVPAGSELGTITITPIAE